MAFHLYLSPAMRTQPIGIPGEKLSAFLVDRPAIVLKEHILKAGGGRSALFGSNFVQLPSGSRGVGLG
jgi:hypothetical protein